MASTTVPINSFYIRLGARIRRLRKAKGISRTAFAEQVGYTGAMITHIEMGLRNINLEKLVKIARLLGVSVDYLLTGGEK